MSGLAVQSWEEPVELINSGLVIVVASPTYDVAIYTSYSENRSDLTTGFCVQVLYHAINLMASRAPGFYQSSNYIVKWVDEKAVPVGRILVSTLKKAEVAMSSAGNFSTNALLTNVSRNDDLLAASDNVSSQTGIWTADTGQIIDPDDKDYYIRYQFHGEKLPAGDVLNAAIDGLALTAVYEFAAHVDSITALSVSRNVVWHVGQSSHELLIASEISRVFTSLIDGLMLKERRFQELWYEVFFDGEMIADGYILKWDPNTAILRK